LRLHSAPEFGVWTRKNVQKLLALFEHLAPTMLQSQSEVALSTMARATLDEAVSSDGSRTSGMPSNPLPAQPARIKSFPGAIIRYATESEVGVPAQTVLTPVVPPSETVLERLCKWVQLELFLDVHLWRATFIEFVGTALLTYFAVGAGISVSAHRGDYSYPPTAVGILIGLIIPIMIFSSAPSSGGHLNSLISIATWMAGLCEFPRMVCYVTAQVTGSILGALALKASIAQHTIDQTLLGMCLHGQLDEGTVRTSTFGMNSPTAGRCRRRDLTCLSNCMISTVVHWVACAAARLSRANFSFLFFCCSWLSAWLWIRSSSRFLVLYSLPSSSEAPWAW
jgi:hypothetical protein